MKVPIRKCPVQFSLIFSFLGSIFLFVKRSAAAGNLQTGEKTQELKKKIFSDRTVGVLGPKRNVPKFKNGFAGIFSGNERLAANSDAGKRRKRFTCGSEWPQKNLPLLRPSESAHVSIRDKEEVRELRCKFFR